MTKLSKPSVTALYELPLLIETEIESGNWRERRRQREKKRRRERRKGERKGEVDEYDGIRN